MKKTVKSLAALSMAAILAIPAYAAEAPSAEMKKMQIHQSAAPMGKVQQIDYKALEDAADNLGDLIDDMEDAKTAEQKAAIQAKIDELVSAHDEFKEFAQDYTVMTKAQLDAAEDKAEELEDMYEAMRKSARHHDYKNQAPEKEPGKETAENADFVRAERVRPAMGANVNPVKEIAEKLEDLIDDMEDAQTSEQKAAIQAKIDELISARDEFKEFVQDYAGMTKAQLDAAEDAVEEFADKLKAAGKMFGQALQGDEKEIVSKTKEETISELEALIKELEDAQTDEEIAAVKAKIAALVMPEARRAFRMEPNKGNWK